MVVGLFKTSGNTPRMFGLLWHRMKIDAANPGHCQDHFFNNLKLRADALMTMLFLFPILYSYASQHSILIQERQQTLAFVKQVIAIADLYFQ